MANLSRTEKYRELRDRLQHESTSSDSFSTPELKQFSQRLNQIDANNFAAPEKENSEKFDPGHARIEQPVEEIAKEIEQASRKPVFDMRSYSRNENDSDLPGNDYLDDVIREVKQYNIDQGNAVSENTSVNVFSQITEPRVQQPQKPQKPLKPYAEDKKNDTADILPFMSSYREYKKDDTNTEKIMTAAADEEPHISSSETMSREDIMAEVQNLVNGKPAERKPDYESELLNSIDDDRTTRQKLLNETSHMRAQLDGYEDNLSEVNDKMRYTNRILNLVLIVLIIALLVILFIMIYWVVLSRGA